MEKKFFQTSIKDSLLTGLIALALFGPIVGLRTVAKNEVLEVHPKWFIVLIIVIVCAVGRFLTNLYVYNRDQKTGIQSSIGKSISNFLDTKGYQIALTAIIFSLPGIEAINGSSPKDPKHWVKRSKSSSDNAWSGKLST